MLLLAAILAASLQSSPPPQLGTIEGLVTRAGSTRTPIVGASIKVSDPRQMSTFSSETTTDAAGHFSVPDVPAGTYAIEISHEGFGYRQASVSAFKTSVTVTAGRSARVPEVLLTAAGVISGHVLDTDDKGVSAAVEILQMRTDQLGRKVWEHLPGKTLTDDQGAFRKTVFGSGDYYVRAIVETGAVPLTIYYPETTEGSRAVPVFLPENSESVANIRIGSAINAKGFKISGKVVQPNVSVRSPFVRLALTEFDPDGPIDDSPATSIQNSLRANDDSGDFEFQGIRPGDYELSANVGINGISNTANAAIVIRDSDVGGVELAVRPPFFVNGSLVIDGEPQDVQFAGGFPTGEQVPLVELALDPVNGRLTNGRGFHAYVDNTGKNFSFRIPEGDYKISARLLTDGKPSGQNLYIADIRAGGRSVIDNDLRVGIDPVGSIEVVVGTKGGTIAGEIAGNGYNLNGYNLPALLVLIPEKSTSSNASPSSITLVSDGHFQVSGIAPGNYRLFGVPLANEPIPYGSPDFIDRYKSRALGVTVQKGVTSGGLKVPLLSLEK